MNDRDVRRGVYSYDGRRRVGHSLGFEDRVAPGMVVASPAFSNERERGDGPDPLYVVGPPEKITVTPLYQHGEFVGWLEDKSLSFRVRLCVVEEGPEECPSWWKRKQEEAAAKAGSG